MQDALVFWWRRPGGLGEVTRMALPLVVSTMSMTVMQFIDRVFLLGYSADSVAAALPSGALFFWLICLPLGVASYVNTFAAQHHGAGETEKAGAYMWQGIWIAIASAPLVVATIPLALPVFTAGGAPGDIVEMEVQYYVINTWSALPHVASAAVAGLFTGIGRVRVVMVIDLLAAAVNIVLDYLWIFGYAGFPEWGLAGAAWATVLAVWLRLAMYLAVAYWPRYRGALGIDAGRRFDKHLLARLLKFGGPSGVQWFIEVGGFTIFLLLIGRLDRTESAATSLAFNVNSLAYMPVWGIGTAAMALVGQHMGQRRDDLAARSAWSALALAELYIFFLSLVYVLLPGWLLAMHSAVTRPEDFEELRETTILLLRFVAAYSMFDALNMILASAIKGAGDTRFVMLINLALVPLPAGLTYLGLEYWGFGLHWAWLMLTLWVILLGLAFLVRFLGGQWRQMSVLE